MRVNRIDSNAIMIKEAFWLANIKGELNGKKKSTESTKNQPG
jgi:hypothetical protein